MLATTNTPPRPSHDEPTVALAVAKAAADEGVAEHPLEDPIQQVYSRMWRPCYPQIELA